MSRTWNQMQLDECKKVRDFFEDNERGWEADPNGHAGSTGGKWVFYGNLIECADIPMSKKIMHELYQFNKGNIEKTIARLEKEISKEEKEMIELINQCKR